MNDTIYGLPIDRIAELIDLFNEKGYDIRVDGDFKLAKRNFFNKMEVIKMEENEKLKVAENMRKYGGSFVNCLGETLLKADHINAQKIKDTWIVLWNHYKEM